MMTIEQLENLREQRGLEIAHKESQVTRIEETLYTVRSQSGNGEYAVSMVDSEWVCECSDNKFRNVKCKHVFAIEFSIALRNVVSNVRIEPIEITLKCIYCGSDQIVKNAIRHNRRGDLQRYRCKSCSKRFSINIGFEKMRATPQVVTSAMQLYFTGESLRNVQKFLKLQGVTINHVTVLRWIRRYVKLMEGYLKDEAKR